MKSICLFFEVHQPFRLKRYRFFDIGTSSYYYDDYSNESIMHKIAQKCYIPTLQLLLKLIHENEGKFKVSFSVSGTAIDQFSLYAPEVLDLFKQLSDTKCVEFLAETYAHSLVSLKDKTLFKEQVDKHKNKIKETFGYTPKTFRNTEMIYSDKIGKWVSELGYKTMLTEGAKHVLGWKSPNYVYSNALTPKLNVLLRNFPLSDDIAFRFSNQSWSEWPLTAEKYAGWINEQDVNSQTINLFMDFETFGEHQWAESGIFDFLESMPKAIFDLTNYGFATPDEISSRNKPVSEISVPNTISWADEERDLSAWVGNDLQNAAFEKLYSLAPSMKECPDKDLQRDWCFLQTSDHFYYMCTKFFSDGAVHEYFNPYESPYDAFINYMNILSDFEIRLQKNADCQPEDNSELVAKIKKQEAELKRMKMQVKNLNEKLKTE
jgi:alpha-amylase